MCVQKAYTLDERLHKFDRLQHMFLLQYALSYILQLIFLLQYALSYIHLCSVD